MKALSAVIRRCRYLKIDSGLDYGEEMGPFTLRPPANRDDPMMESAQTQPTVPLHFGVAANVDSSTPPLMSSL